MDLEEAKQILKEHKYTLEPMNEGIGDWAKRVFTGETKLGQEMEKMGDKTAKYFAGRIIGCLSGAGEKLKNNDKFIDTLLMGCDNLSDGIQEIASKYPKNNAVAQIKLSKFIEKSVRSIMADLADMENLINYNDKVFKFRIDPADYERWAKQYSEKYGTEGMA